MAQPLALSFRIDAQTAAAIQQVGAFTRALQAATGVKPIPDPTREVQAGVAASSKSLTGFVAQLAAVAGAAATVGAALKKGFAANAEMETAVIGIKGIIASLQNVKDASGKPAEGMDRLAISGVEAEKQLKLLRVAGMQTSAEFKDLAKAFQTALGAGSSAGLDADQIRQLTVSLTLAAGAFNLAGDQLSSEIRAMLSGDQIDNSQIAQGLGINSKQIKQWRESGKLFEELNKRLQNFVLLGDEAGKTWTATLSNVGDGISLFLSQATKGAFDKLKTSFQDALSGAFDQNGDLQQSFQGLADLGSKVFGGIGDALAAGIDGAIGAAKSLSAIYNEHSETIDGILSALGRIASVITDGISSGFSDLLKATGSVGDKVTFVRDALNGVSLVAAVIVDTVKGLAGTIGYVGGVIASALLDPLLGVARVLSGITGKDYTAGLAKVKAATEQFKESAKAYALNSFNFDTVKKVKAQIEAEYASSPIKAVSGGSNTKTNKPTGTVTAPKRKPSDDAKKAAEQYADALLAYEKAKDDADKKINKTVKEAQLRDLEESFSLRLKTQKDYLKQKADLDLQENEQNLAAARREEAATQARIAKEKDPAKRKKLEGDLLKVQAEIKELESKGADIPARLKIQLREFQEQVDSLRVEIQAEILDQEGQPLEAALKRLGKKTQDLLNDPRVRGDEKLTAAVNTSSKNQEAKLKMEDAKRIAEYEASVFTAAKQRIEEEVQRGEITEIEAQKAIQAEQAKTVKGLEDYVLALSDLRAQFPKNKEIALAFDQATDALEKARRKSNEVAASINRTFADNASTAVGDFVTGALSHLEDLVRGSENASSAIKGVFHSAWDAIRGFAFSMIDDIAKRYQKLFADELFKKLQGGNGGGIGGAVSTGMSGGGWGAVASSIGSFFGFADGGHVKGPGTGTSDSIPAWLSNGEFVLKAASVRKWGLGFLNSLNAGVMPRTASRFASGGYVGNSPGLTPELSVQNNFTPRLYMNPDHVASEIGRTPQFGRDVMAVFLANKNKLGLPR